jgi:hypothetical protein
MQQENSLGPSIQLIFNFHLKDQDSRNRTLTKTEQINKVKKNLRHKLVASICRKLNLIGPRSGEIAILVSSNEDEDDDLADSTGDWLILGDCSILLSTRDLTKCICEVDDFLCIPSK